MTMVNRTTDSLIAEFRTEVHDKIPRMKAAVQGERCLLEARLLTQEQRNHSAVWWILSAHIGTLEKLSTMLRREGPYESFELLAVARNIFENLVWLRLMREPQFRHLGRATQGQEPTIWYCVLRATPTQSDRERPSSYSQGE